MEKPDHSDHSSYWVDKRQEVIDNPDKKYIAPYAIAEVGNTGLLEKENIILKPYRLHVLREVCKLLDILNLRYWISDGTLLGWHREKKMISHDIDVDISIMEEDMYELWMNRSKLPPSIKLSCDDTMIDGFKWCEDGMSDSKPFVPEIPSAKKLIAHHMELPNPDTTPISWDAACDIYTFRSEGEYVRNNYSKGGQGIEEKRFPVSCLFPLRRETFEGISVRVPNDSETWLTVNYGYIGKNAYWCEKDKCYKPA